MKAFIHTSRTGRIVMSIVTKGGKVIGTAEYATKQAAVKTAEKMGAKVVN